MYNLENTFWDKTHPMYDRYDELHEQLVPNRGQAETTGGELLRAISNIYYDHYNNGSCNARIGMSRKLVALSESLPEDAQEEIEFVHDVLDRLDGVEFGFYIDDVLPYSEIEEFENALESITEAIVNHLTEPSNV